MRVDLHPAAEAEVRASAFLLSRSLTGGVPRLLVATQAALTELEVDRAGDRPQGCCVVIRVG